jgi:hypothetical protein
VPIYLAKYAAKTTAHTLKLVLPVLLISGGSIFGYIQLTKSNDPYKTVSSSEKLKGEVSIGDLAFKESHKIGKLFGYENSWSYPYKLDQSPEFIRIKKDDNWLEKGVKAVGGVFVGKDYTIDLSSYFMLGYDLSKLSKNDFLYDKKEKTLTILLPELEMVYTPDYSESKFASNIGMFRLPFTEEERRNIYVDSINKGAQSFIKHETKEINKGHQDTQEAIENLLLKSPEISKNVRSILFVTKGENVALSIEEYKNYTKGDKKNGNS